jgi:hypothetical protein
VKTKDQSVRIKFVSAPMILQNAVPMSFLVDNGLLKEDGFPAKYLAGVLGALVQSVGQDKTASLWRASRVNIEDFVDQDKVNEFVTKHVSSQKVI